MKCLNQQRSKPLSKPNTSRLVTKDHGDVSEQHARFLETARALGCDEDEAAFDEKLRAMVPAKPKEQKPDGT